MVAQIPRPINIIIAQKAPSRRLLPILFFGGGVFAIINLVVLRVISNKNAPVYDITSTEK
jgi:hypothetical protein